MKTTIRDRRNQIKGYLEQSDSDRLRAYDKYNVLAGYYSANMDRTRHTARSHPVGRLITYEP